MKFNITKILSEWAYRVDDGQPDVTNTDHVNHLREILYNFGLSHKFIVEYVHRLTEIDFRSQDAFKKYNAKHKMRKTTKVNIAGKDTTAGEVDSTETKSGTKDSTTKAALKELDSKENFDTKIEKAVAKFGSDMFGKNQLKQLKELESNFRDFLENPTEEIAKEMIKKHKLSTNQGGGKLYCGFILGSNGNKVLGSASKGSKLSRSMKAAILSVYPQFEQAEDPRAAGIALVTKNSKPNIANEPPHDKLITYTDSNGEEQTTTAKNAKRKQKLRNGDEHPAKIAWRRETSIASANDGDEVVQEIFANKIFEGIDKSKHEVFGPKDPETRKLLPNRGGENAKAYFEQSIKNNTALDDVMASLVGLEEQGVIAPEMKQALQEHKDELNRILNSFDDMDKDDRAKAVMESYASTAVKMANVDEGFTNSIFKNVAEMALYDSEIAGGKEAYLPSAGTFPSGDKIRVDRTEGDGPDKGTVERIASVSCKYGENSQGVFGYPSETMQYIKYHPILAKRDILKNRGGSKGHAMGIKDEYITDPEKFNTLIEETKTKEFPNGISSAIKDPEKFRNVLLAAKNETDAIRDKAYPPPQKISKAQLVKLRSQFEAVNKKVAEELKDIIDKDELLKYAGKENTNIFMKGGAQAISMIGWAASLGTSNGHDAIEHHHQNIDENGFSEGTNTGSRNLIDWICSDRFYDYRGGGLKTGSIRGGDYKK